MPATHVEFWKAKFDATVERDAMALAALEEAGWTALIIWECEAKSEALERLYERILYDTTTD